MDHFVDNAAATLVERLDEMGRVGELQLSLTELHARLQGTAAANLLNSEYSQAVLERARQLVHLDGY
ncbi:hypothetical protein [Candidatus Cyanaurora vandensis]|uniref:hypothetical protein n=1 Tax=Candidatus Cyanaurora vandensis TaxID=2714958 RepID=UPI00258074A4|nr:hypothetical protein [Candidatus Cyanaurora vandensis]